MTKQRRVAPALARCPVCGLKIRAGSVAAHERGPQHQRAAALAKK